ncbi:MAG: GAF domain-containing protein [bacterium]
MSLLKKLDVLTEITEAISGVESRDEIFDFILSSLQELFKVDHASIFLADDDKNILKLVCSRGYNKNIDCLILTDSGIAGEAYSLNTPLKINDLKKDADNSKKLSNNLMSGIATPLRVKSKAVGVICVESLKKKYFSESDLKFLSLFAAETAAFINRFEVEKTLQKTSEKLDRRLKQLKTLDYVSQNVISSLSYSDIQERILQAVRDTVKTADKFAFIIYDEKKRELIVKSVLGHDNRIVDRFALKPCQGITGAAFSEKQEILVPDVKKDHRFIPGQMREAGSEIAIPLLIKDKPVGVIDIVSENRNAFDNIERKFLRTLSSFASIAIGNSKLFEENERAFFETTKLLAEALDARDNYTRGHSERVTYYTGKILDEMHLPENEKEEIYYSAVLHDIGKIGITDTILNKKGYLTSSEFAVIRSHVTVGEKILADSRSMRKISKAVKHHHERWDGKGYPDGLKKEDIPVSARVIAVADAYDAMTSNRPYRAPLSEKEALLEIDQNRGTQFDSLVVDAFFAFMNK